MSEYQICKVNIIIKDKQNESLKINDDKSIEQYDSKEINNDDFNISSKNISLSISNIDSSYVYQFVSYTCVMHFDIKSIYKTNLIGTNILLKNGEYTPTVIVDKNITYKKLIREELKKLGINNKYISTIKHISNKENYHHYLIYLNYSNKILKQFKNSLNHVKSDSFMWKTFFGFNINKNISELSLSDKYKFISKNNNYCFIKLEDSNKKININQIYSVMSDICSII